MTIRLSHLLLVGALLLTPMGLGACAAAEIEFPIAAAGFERHPSRTTQYGTGSFVDPATDQPRLIPLELGLKGETEPHYGAEIVDPAENAKLSLKHDRGALAMARSADPNSASAQFYIALQPLTELDGRYAVFGRVVKGMEVVDRIKQGDRLIKANQLQEDAHRYRGNGAGAMASLRTASLNLLRFERFQSIRAGDGAAPAAERAMLIL